MRCSAVARVEVTLASCDVPRARPHEGADDVGEPAAKAPARLARMSVTVKRVPRGPYGSGGARWPNVNGS